MTAATEPVPGARAAMGSAVSAGPGGDSLDPAQAYALGTSPAESARLRRQSEELDVFYSDDPDDLGNIGDYEQFLERLVAIYAQLKPLLRPRAYLTIIVKNVKKGGVIYPLAWDLARLLGETYTLKDEKIWCQDDIRLAPYGMGNAWVSNTFHHYCLQFRRD